ncbi:Adenine DNA glycosylase [Rhizobiaceae bacterium]|nr:Adenine DNA glycosylase [Rhizobiaceae bacterium]
MDQTNVRNETMIAAKPGESTPGNDFARRLLSWYDEHHRKLPWRVGPRDTSSGMRADPYRVWLSEIMLQQTTVEAVKPYFRAFVDRWPDITALANAAEEDVMKAWAGLGYYSRARNLKNCADLVTTVYGGRFPNSEEGLRTLPGIGDYTAAAIAAIAFGRPAAVVDGNVERVMTRFRAIEIPLPEAKRIVREALRPLVPADRPGDFAQATMDLGATICTPRRPSCFLCPLRPECSALEAGDPERFPLRAAKAGRPLRRGAAFVAMRPDGAILLRRRPDKGLLGGMSEVPTSGWSARVDGDATPQAAPLAADWIAAGKVLHVFTHFELELSVYRAAVPDFAPPPGHRWARPDDIHDEALPTVMKKAIEAAIPGVTRQRRPQG